MYYQNYEDYIRNILGYPIMTTNNQYAGNTNSVTYNYDYITNRPIYSQDILNLYPEIYKILNPMVCKICESNTKPITRELLDQMTDEIYLNIESDNLNSDLDTVNIRVNIQKENSENSNKSKINAVNNTTSNRRKQLENSVEKNKEKNKEENRETGQREIETRQNRRPRNPILRDLIRILILNQLLYGNPRPRPRPRPYYLDNSFNQMQPQMPRDNRYYNNF